MTQNYPEGIRQQFALGIALIIGIAVSLAMVRSGVAQANATPVPIVLPTQSPTTLPTATIAITAAGVSTPSGLVVVEAQDATVGSNVRQGPGTDAPILGKIFPGDFYPVLGKYQMWIEIQYGKPDPNTIGWVFSGVVKVTGSLASVPDVNPNSLPTINVAAAQAQNTALAITQTPGAIGSATVLQASATGVTTLSQPNVPTATPGGPMPTFTFPPPFIEATLAPRTASSASPSQLPPIVPILGLAVVGLLGLLISALRRG